LNTQAKYAALIKGFMMYYGEPIEDLKIRQPQAAPQIVEEETLEKLFYAARNKKSHKTKEDRDILIFEPYLKTGVRRGKLANLKVKHVHKDFIMVIKGKGVKERRIPLLPDSGRHCVRIKGRVNW